MPAIARSLTAPAPMLLPLRLLAGMSLICLMGLLSPLRAAALEDFIGTYSGWAEVENASGEMSLRDLSVVFSAQQRDNFTLTWKTVSYRSDGRVKDISYTIDFVPSDRDGVYAAAMGTNVFGHSVQLDPMKGDPYVWAQLQGKTLTVYSMFIGEQGGYEMQEYRRTLVEGGLELEFRRFRNGKKMKTVEAFLARQRQ